MTVYESMTMAQACGEAPMPALAFIPGEDFDPHDEDDREAVRAAMDRDQYDDECVGDPSDDRPCAGDRQRMTSASGCTVSVRCERHADAYLDRMDRLDADISSRYPGWNVPGSSAPEWFDEADAGERWDDDY